MDVFLAFNEFFNCVEQNLNDHEYLRIIADKVPPVMLLVYPAGCGNFKQYNAPFHNASIVRR